MWSVGKDIGGNDQVRERVEIRKRLWQGKGK